MAPGRILKAFSPIFPDFLIRKEICYQNLFGETRKTLLYRLDPGFSQSYVAKNSFFNFPFENLIFRPDPGLGNSRWI